MTDTCHRCHRDRLHTPRPRTLRWEQQDAQVARIVARTGLKSDAVRAALVESRAARTGTDLTAERLDRPRRARCSKGTYSRDAWTPFTYARSGTGTKDTLMRVGYRPDGEVLVRYPFERRAS